MTYTKIDWTGQGDPRWQIRPILEFPKEYDIATKDGKNISPGICHKHLVVIHFY